MSSRHDPLAAAEAFTRAAVLDRVFYATGVLLAADDFDAEQTYHRGRLARALAYLQGSGTVAGLRVVVAPALAGGADPAFPQGREEELRVEPGLAVDRLGRLIEIPRAACLRLDRWYQGEEVDRLRTALHGVPVGGVIVDVFVRYVPCERGKTPAFAAGPFDALDAVQPSRLRDAYELTLVPRPEANPALPETGELGLPGGSPAAPLPPATDPAGRRAALHAAIFNGWREGTEWWTDRGLVALREHATGQDPTALFLARLVLPATAAPTADERPVRTPGADVGVDNDSRRFVYSTVALARGLGLTT
jgi:hypothetical protein